MDRNAHRGVVVDSAPVPGADVDPASLLDLLGLLAQLVEQARAAGELRSGVTVADVVLVLTASVPAQPNGAGGADGQAAVDGSGGANGDGTGTADAGAPGGTSARLLRILLDGLRAGA
jgi:hypothetical protein